MAELARLGAVIEQVHTASLLHDDVIDDAATRRGAKSANNIYGNKVPVLAGNCLYTSAFLSLIDLFDIVYSRLIVRTVNRMCAAEVLQMANTGNLDITMDVYTNIIHGKTSALFSTACAFGAILGGNIHTDSLLEYGVNVGYAFQMQDDVLDYYGSEEHLGKKPGADLGEFKVTLPIILLREALKDKKAEILPLFNSNIPVNAKLQEFRCLFENYNIYPKSQEIINGYLDKAVCTLNSFGDSVYRDILLSLTESIAIREL
jgi:octaprenyl-diphosphate synthase